MHDDDLRNFFDEDAYKELLDTYAEEDPAVPQNAARQKSADRQKRTAAA